MAFDSNTECRSASLVPVDPRTLSGYQEYAEALSQATQDGDELQQQAALVPVDPRTLEGYQAYAEALIS